MIQSLGMAAFNPRDPLVPWEFTRREPGPRDVVIDIEYCGICHSDLHTVRAEWGKVNFPVVPGHEIVGTVRSLGAEVTRFKPGERVGVGCLVDSCRTCSACQQHLEQYCTTGNTWTYDSIEKETGRPTQGGYSLNIVVTEDFVLRVPGGLDPAAAAPLLCAGTTTWSPLVHHAVGPGTRMGVVGLGGLGHMAVKLAAAMGAEVLVFTRSENKVADAKRLGAAQVVVGEGRGSLNHYRESLDFILDTVSAPHDLEYEMRMLRLDGSLCLVGVSPEAHGMPLASTFIGRRRSITGSLIGGIRETQEMLDFCGQHSISADIELISADYINAAYERMLRSDVKYRFVMDVATLKGTVGSV